MIRKRDLLSRLQSLEGREGAHYRESHKLYMVQGPKYHYPDGSVQGDIRPVSLREAIYLLVEYLKLEFRETELVNAKIEIHKKKTKKTK